ncbi:MAG: hypothetical protein A2046_10110 [Bacteroidetes bacterium GWA2_30_7]|nr:MAG: hypothetical protein A2046_10110 [Bacteroidetes bacterium GWA2_30_7]
MSATIDEGPYLGWMYFLLGIAVASVLIFPAIFFITNPKGAKGALVGLVALVVIGGISYLLADSTIPKFIGSELIEITESTSKMVDTGLFGLYILSVLTALSIVYIEVAKMFK